MSEDAILEVPVQLSLRTPVSATAKCRRDSKTGQQKNHPAEPRQPTKMCEILINGCFVTLSFEVDCYITIGKPSFLNYPQHSPLAQLAVSPPQPHLVNSCSTIT